MLKYLPTYYSKYQLNCFFLLFIIRRQQTAGLSPVMEPVGCDRSTSVSAPCLWFPFRVPLPGVWPHRPSFSAGWRLEGHPSQPFVLSTVSILNISRIHSLPSSLPLPCSRPSCSSSAAALSSPLPPSTLTHSHFIPYTAARY